MNQLKKQQRIFNKLFFVLFKKNKIKNIIFFLIGFCTCGFLFVGFTLNSLESIKSNVKITDKSATSIINEKHKLAIVIPFRDRFDELLTFVPHISKFLNLKSINYKIYILNQIDDYRFNRASLINVGFLYSMSDGCDYMAMHDVDLLPLTDKLNYSYPQNGLYHVSAAGIHPEYDYATFIGGILIVNKNDFLLTNGIELVNF